MNMLELKKKAKAASADYQASILARKQGAAPITEEDLAESDDVSEAFDDETDAPDEDQFEDQNGDEPDDEDVEEETSSSTPQNTTINNTPFLAADTSTALDQAMDDDDDDIGTFVDVPPEPMDMPEESNDVPVEEATEPPQTAFERPEIYSKPAAQKKPQEQPAKTTETAEKKEKKKKGTSLSAYNYEKGGAREIPTELEDLVKSYFPSCNNKSLAVGAYILLHEGMPKNLQDTPEIFYETAKDYIGPAPGATSADTVEDIEDLKTEMQKLRTDNRNLMHKLETIELGLAFLLVQYNAAIPTNTEVEKLKFSGDKVDEVMRNLSAAAVNKSISDKHNSGRPIR